MNPDILLDLDDGHGHQASSFWGHQSEAPDLVAGYHNVSFAAAPSTNHWSDDLPSNMLLLDSEPAATMIPNNTGYFTEPSTMPDMMEISLEHGPEPVPPAHGFGNLRFTELDSTGDYPLPNPVGDIDRSAAERCASLTVSDQQSGKPWTDGIDHVDQGQASNARHPTSADWAQYRKLITSLYSEMTLPKVMQNMEKEYGFVATTKMYKSRFTRWGLDNKNNRERELRAAVRKHGKRAQQGKDSVCLIRGKPVDYEKMVRHFYRKRIPIEDVIAQRKTSLTPEAVACVSPVRSPSPPRVYEVSEHIFVTVRDYVDGSFDSTTWIRTEAARYIYSANEAEATPTSPGVGFLAQYQEIQSLLRLGMYREAEMVRESMTTRFPQILNCESPYLLPSLFDVLTNEANLDLALNMLKTIVQLGAKDLGQQHPLPRVAGLLLQVDPAGIPQIREDCLRALADMFHKILGPLHATSLHMCMRECSTSSKGVLRDLLHMCQADLGADDSRTFQVHIDWAWQLFDAGQYDLAKAECHSIISQTHKAKPTEVTMYFRAEGLYLLQGCQARLWGDQLGIVNLREAIEIRISCYGSWDTRARQWLLDLKELLNGCGREEEVAEVQQWWEMMRQADLAAERESHSEET